MMFCRGLVGVVVVGAFVASAAASPESDRLFREGRELLKAGRVAEACEAFAGSQRLAARVGTLLNLADCREKQGQTATAWALFVEAKQLAEAQRDARRAEAERRAEAIKAKLAYLTIAVARERQVEGLVIKRNGVPVDAAQWNAPVAVDPGDYVIEASAPRFRPWSTTQAVGAKQKVEVVVEALAADAVVAPEVRAPAGESARAPDAGTPGPGPERGDAPAPAARPRLPDPQLRPVSLGLLVGRTGDDDTVFGGRLTGGLAVPHGAVRLIGSLLYASFLDDPDNNSDSVTDLYAFGLSAEYAWMPIPNLAFSAGLGVGIDWFDYNLDREDESSTWWTLRASPLIVRLVQGRVEAGLHLQYVQTADRGVVLGLVGIDVFPL